MVSSRASFAGLIAVSLTLALAGCGGKTDPAGGGGGTGGAIGAGGAGGGASGAGGSAGSAASSWASCAKPGECALAGKGCCDACHPELGDVDAVARTQLSAHEKAVCPVQVSCGPCADTPGPNPSLAAFCVASTCTAVDVRVDDVSACQTDDDCLFRGAGCCECGSPGPVALAKSKVSEYLAQVCPIGDVGCPACLPIYPPGTKAVCGPTKHCAVVLPDVCPTEQPNDGAPCTQAESLSCEYGTDLRPACRVHATCKAGKWSAPLPKCAGVPVAGQGSCPTSSAASGMSCAADGLVCDMGGGASCTCTQCPGGPCSTAPIWACWAPQGGNCPGVAPDLGQSCNVEGVSCGYGLCGGPTGTLRKCNGGVWVEVPQSCPV